MHCAQVCTIVAKILVNTWTSVRFFVYCFEDSGLYRVLRKQLLQRLNQRCGRSQITDFVSLRKSQDKRSCASAVPINNRRLLAFLQGKKLMHH